MIRYRRSVSADGVLRQLQDCSKSLTDIHNLPDIYTGAALEVIGQIVIADGQENKALAVLGEKSSWYGLRVVRANKHQPGLADRGPGNRRPARRMLDALEGFEAEQLFKSLAGDVEVANDEINVVNASRGHAQAAVGNIPAFGNSAGTPLPSSASSQRLVSMTFARSTPDLIPERSSM